MTSSPIKVDAVAHDERKVRDSELEELRKKALTKQYRGFASKMIKKNDLKQKLEKSKSTDNEESTNSSKQKDLNSNAYMSDSWAMQQRAQAELERKKRQEAESFLRGYNHQPNNHALTTKNTNKRSKKFQSHHGGNDFAMQQRARAEEERRKRQEAELYLRNYKYVAPRSDKSTVNSPNRNSNGSTSSVDHESIQDDMKSESSTGLGDFLSFLNLRNKNNKKGSKNEKEQENFDGNSNPPSTKDHTFSPTSVIHQDAIEVKRLSNLRTLPFQNENEDTGNTPLRKTKQKKFLQEDSKSSSPIISKTEASKEAETPPMRPNWNLNLFMTFEPSKNIPKNLETSTIAEKWKINLIFTVHFSSKRMNEVAIRSGNVRKKFEKKFGDAGIDLVQDVLEQCADAYMSHDMVAVSSRALDENVIESFNRKEPIKVLVQTESKITRQKEADIQTLRRAITNAFRSAIARGSFSIMSDMN